MKFREDIQGLRALAVLSVVIFHVDFSFLKGGFLGVDIFFVISGYLISGIILDQVQAGSFTLSGFYLRRLRRLLPASVVTIVVTLVAAAFIFGQTDLAQTGRTGLHALLFASNFVFWLDAGYFDAASHTKPFLHFWSLSVEEQFYLLWPALLVGGYALLRKAGVILSVALLTAVSLYAAELYFATAPSATFFLTPFRVFEFGIGALVSVTGLRAGHTGLQSVVWPAGLILMIASIVMLDGADRMPGLLSLFSVVGCALCLMCPEAKTNLLLRNPLTTSIGNASYSIYLVHWPPVVFYKYSVSETLTLPVQISLIGAGLALGYLLYLLVETPFRQEKFWRLPGAGSGRIILGSFASALALYATAATWATNGWRPSQAGQSAGTNASGMVTNVAVLRDETWARRDAIINSPRRADAKLIVVIGDSHGKDFVNVLGAKGNADIRHENISHWCQPVIGPRPDGILKEAGKPASPAEIELCQTRMSEILESDNIKSADLVVYTSKILPWASAQMGETLRALRENTQAPLVCVGRGVSFEQPIYRMAEKIPEVDALNRAANEKAVRYENFNRNLITIGNANDCSFLNKAVLMCPQGLCEVADAETQKLYYYDFDHLTVEGAAFLAERINQCRSKSCTLIRDAMRDSR